MIQYEWVVIWAEDAAVTNLMLDLSCLKKVCKASLMIKGRNMGCKTNGSVSSSPSAALLPCSLSLSLFRAMLSNVQLVKQQWEKRS